MSDNTPLDLAHSAMQSNPEEDAARLKFYQTLADTEMFILLTKEPDGDHLDPEVFDVADARFVLVFDTEERLSTFTGRPSPYAALSGRYIAVLLSGSGIGLAVNPDVATSSILIPAEGVEWLVEVLADLPTAANDNFQTVSAPTAVPNVLVDTIERKLETAAGFALAAYIAQVTYSNGSLGHAIAFLDAAEQAHAPLAKAINEAVVFSGLEAALLDVVFLRAESSAGRAFARFGQAITLPVVQTAETYQPKAPGMDPNSPPKLR